LAPRDFTVNESVNFHFLLRDLGVEVDAGRLTEPEAAVRVAEYIQKVLKCTYVTFWSVSGEPGQRIMRREAAYDGPRQEAVLTAVQFPEAGGGYFGTLLEAGCYVCADTFADPQLAGVRESTLIPYNIHSLLSASWGRNGEVWGIITCTDNVPRKWTPSEVTSLRKCAAEISVRRARRRERLREAEARRIAGL
jgi:GAF domain-containing protein